MNFPSTFRNETDIAKVLYHTAVLGGGVTANVHIPQYNSLRTHVQEITRSPAGESVRELSRITGIWVGEGDAADIPVAGAAELFAVCLTEASALLELGYPIAEGLDFITEFPSPGMNKRRTLLQIRSAMHHIGGDFDVLKDLVRSKQNPDECLKVIFSVWPPEYYPEDSIFLHLEFSEQRIPAVMRFKKAISGYMLLTCWDVVLRLKKAEGIQITVPDFSAFAAGLDV